MRPAMIVVVVFALGVMLAGCGSSTPPRPDRPAAQGLRFEPNLGQADPRVTHVARAPGQTLLLTRDGAMLKLRDAAVRMTFAGANPAPRVSERGPLAGVSNYLRGRDPSGWVTDVPSYGEVVYRGLYDGVDLKFHSSRDGELEFDYLLAPGADPDAIRLRYAGTRALRIDDDGALVLRAGRSALRQLPPLVYQDGRKLPARYVLRGDHEVGFALEGYDRSARLLIDPVLSYSTYLGGSDEDSAIWSDVDKAGNFYVTGFTASPDFPTTPGAYRQEDLPGGDVFITKLNRSGSGLVWSTYLGGDADEAALGLDVNHAGNVVVTGDTTSTDFPTTRGAYQRTRAGDNDAFVTQLDRSGSRLDWSTLLGGSGTDTGFISFFGRTGDVFVEGRTSSADYPTTRRAFQTTYGGGELDGFVTRLTGRGSKLVYSTFIGGSAFDGAHDGWLDEHDDFYIDGPTASADFPTTRGAFDRTLDGESDAFAAKLDSSGKRVHYSTYLGGSGFEDVFDMTADRDGNAYVPGITNSDDFPTTPRVFQPAYGGGDIDGYLAKLNKRGTGLVYATYIGGTSFDFGGGVRVDARGEAHMVGATGSTDFPVTGNALQSEFGGEPADAFILTFNDTASRLRFSTFLGGSGDDGSFGAGEWLDDRGNFYVPGFTDSPDFPVTTGAFQTENAGGYDVWLAKIAPSRRGHKGDEDVHRAPAGALRRAAPRAYEHGRARWVTRE